MDERTGGSRPRRRRWVLVVSVGLLVVLGLFSAGFAQDGPRGAGRVCQAPYDSEFDDIAGSVHAQVIRCLADHGITRGRGDGSYGPRVGVRRDQMASFVARFLEAAQGEPLEAGDARFDDVAAESPHAEAINGLAAARVVEGTGDGRYEPGGVVGRDAMASFIRRAIAYLDDGQATNGSQPPPGPEERFSDVPAGNVHADNIVALAGQGIVAGFGDGTYRPRQPVTRGQMAAFVMRGYDYADQQALTAGHAEGQDDQDSDTGGDGGTGDSDADDGGSGDGDTGEGEGEAARLAGTVTDGDSEEPIAGATVAVEEIAGATATTGDQGGYTIDELPAGEHTVTATAEGYEQASRQVTLEEGEQRDDVDFALPPADEPDDEAGAISGTVTDPEEQPLSGTTVTVDEIDDASATTDNDGRYAIDDVPAGEYTVTAKASGYEPDSRTVEVGAGQTVTGVDFSLRPRDGPEPAWADPDEATITPGVQMRTGGSQCTSNFIFTGSSEADTPDGRGIYIGYVAHCAADSGVFSTPGCDVDDELVHRPGTQVDIEGASQPGHLVYSSWATMQDRDETDRNICRTNDFAIVAIHPEDHERVNPSIPFWGGPDGIGGTSELGEKVYSYGSSSLRGGIEALSPQEGYLVERTHDGWEHGYYVVTAGIFGDSGSAVLDQQGRALGALTTLTLAPLAGSNAAVDLSRALAYANEHGGVDLSLATGTEPFGGGRLLPDVDTTASVATDTSACLVCARR